MDRKFDVGRKFLRIDKWKEYSKTLGTEVSYIHQVFVIALRDHTVYGKFSGIHYHKINFACIL